MVAVVALAFSLQKTAHRLSLLSFMATPQPINISIALVCSLIHHYSALDTSFDANSFWLNQLQGVIAELRRESSVVGRFVLVVIAVAALAFHYYAHH